MSNTMTDSRFTSNILCQDICHVCLSWCKWACTWTILLQTCGNRDSNLVQIYVGWYNCCKSCQMLLLSDCLMPIPEIEHENGFTFALGSYYYMTIFINACNRLYKIHGMMDHSWHSRGLSYRHYCFPDVILCFPQWLSFGPPTIFVSRSTSQTTVYILLIKTLF